MAYFCAKYADESGTYWGTCGDDAISGAHTAIHSSDAGDSIDLKGTIYVSHFRRTIPLFIFNPYTRRPPARYTGPCRARA